MAEHGLDGPVLALAWDGTGLGTDGTAWGGELLLAERGRFERLGTFRPLALAGGDRAIRDPWRIALAALLDAFGEDAPLDALPLLPGAVLAPFQGMLCALIGRRGRRWYFKEFFDQYLLERKGKSEKRKLRRCTYLCRYNQ